ncbi:Rha family transcriptional regulator [Enterobacter hormaechei]|uniref:Rha family transcriptional regulator n=1 Tax=Enterobacter hormaechei TaxID=158836 RepID=UPI0033150FC1
MSTDISIRVPKEMATPTEFAEWEGISRGSVYQKIHHGQLAKHMVKKDKNKGRVSIRYLMYKADQVRESLGHSNFRIIVGQ